MGKYLFVLLFLSSSVFGMPYVPAKTPEEIYKEADLILIVHIDEAKLFSYKNKSEVKYKGWVLKSIKGKFKKGERITFSYGNAYVNHNYLVSLAFNEDKGIYEVMGSLWNSVIELYEISPSDECSYIAYVARYGFLEYVTKLDDEVFYYPKCKKNVDSNCELKYKILSYMQIVVQ